MKNYSLKFAVLLFAFAILTGFVSKNQHSSIIDNPEGEICGKTIKYTAEKINTPDGKEISVLTEITINPSDKTILLESVSSDDEKASFYTKIESSDCSFDKKLSSGKAIYTGYIEQKDGTKTPAKVILEATKGKVTLTSYDEADKKALVLNFTKWEILE